MPSTPQFPTASPVLDEYLLLVWNTATRTQQQATIAAVFSSAVSGLVNSVATIAELRAMNPAEFEEGHQVSVSGYYEAGDGGGGVFYASPSSGGADNGGTVIAPDDGTGRWLSLASELTPAMFGCIGDGVEDDTTRLQSAINALAYGQTLRIDDFHAVTGLYIEDKSSIKITGNGRVSLSGAASGAYALELVGTISRLEISGIEITGDGNSGYTQTAIGNDSGQTISDVTFSGLLIRNINVGISCNAYLSGTYDNAVIENVTLRNILGTVSGSGYGVHVARASDVRVSAVVVDNASRHAFYQAAGDDVGNIYANCVIRNHRSGVAEDALRAAFVVARSSGVTLDTIFFIDGYDGGLEIAQETVSSSNCSKVIVTNCQFINRQNVVPSITIGEQAIPGSYNVSDATITNCKFFEDYDVCLGGPTIKILNGLRLTLSECSLRRTNAGTTTGAFAEIGDSLYASNSGDIGDIIVQDNQVDADAQAGGSFAFYISTPLCTGSGDPRYTLRDNTTVNFASQISFQVTPTNPNSRLKFSASVVVDIPNILANTIYAAALTVEGVKPTSQVVGRPQYSLGGDVIYNFMANDAFVNSVGMFVANPTASPADPASQTIRFTVEDF
jgi:hypothetical protein